MKQKIPYFRGFLLFDKKVPIIIVKSDTRR